MGAQNIASRIAHFYRDFCKTCKRIRMKLAISTSIFASVLGQAPGGAAQYLYCINANNHGSNPRMLPNNMCCPFYEQAGIKGKPYHSAVHGCCGTALYDLTTQDCCPEAEVIMEKGTRPSSPTGFFGSAQEIGGEPTILLMWDEAVSGSSYYLDVKSMNKKSKSRSHSASELSTATLLPSAASSPASSTNSKFLPSTASEIFQAAPSSP